MDIYTCGICSSVWPTPDAAEVCAQWPHRFCPTCARWVPAESQYCSYDGTVLDENDCVDFDTEYAEWLKTKDEPSRCWPVTWTDGTLDWFCGPRPPSPEDLATITAYFDDAVPKNET
ncbi:MAG: hypothetical protein ACYCOU_13950 [Sulfobacillus sp.]